MFTNNTSFRKKILDSINLSKSLPKDSRIKIRMIFFVKIHSRNVFYTTLGILTVYVVTAYAVQPADIQFKTLYDLRRSQR